MLRGGLVDAHRTAGDGGGSDEADNFKVVGADGELPAVQGCHALDLEGVGADVGDAGTEGVQEMTQVLDVRFGGGVADDRPATRHAGRHDSVLSGGDAGFVQQHVCTIQTGWGIHRELALAVADLGAQAAQGQEVRVHAAPPDDIAAGWGQVDAAGAMQHRASQQNAGSDAAADVRVEIGPPHFGGMHAPGVRLQRLDRYTQALEQRAHDAHVPDVGDIVQDDRFVGQQAGRKERQGGILVAGGRHLALKLVASLDLEDLHGHCL